MKVDLQELKESVERELLRLEKRRSELQERKEQIEAVQRLAHETGVPTDEVDLSEESFNSAVPEEAGNKKWFNRSGS